MAKRKVKRAKIKSAKIDGWNRKDVARLRSAIRSCWRYSEPHRLVVKRCLLPNGFSRCEGCKKRVARIYVDHIAVMGPIFGERYLERMGCASTQLQGLCVKCHGVKTKEERKAAKADLKVGIGHVPKSDDDFY